MVRDLRKISEQGWFSKVSVAPASAENPAELD